MQLHIWVDCDEVISETINELLKRSPLVEKWIARFDITSYYLSDVEKIWITSDEAVALFYDFFASSEYRETQPVLWAYEKLYERKQAGHILSLVTARPTIYESQTKKWVETHFPGIFSDFLFMNKFSNNEVPKSKLCKKKWIQLLIDDDVQNIQDVNSLWMPGFLLDKPWNQWVENTELLKKVYLRDEIQLSDFF